MSPTPHATYVKATRERRRHMAYARDCVQAYKVSRDDVYLEMARLHVQVARKLNRHAWRAIRRPSRS